MLRLLPLSSNLRRYTPAAARSLSSSAFLSKSWDSESISIGELRAEAKQRGISAKGSKKALSSRIEEHDVSVSTSSSPAGARQAFSSMSTSSNSTKARQASSLSSVSAPSEITLRAESPSHAAPTVAGKRESSSINSSPPPPTAANPTKAPGNPEAPIIPVAPYNFDIKLPDLTLLAPLPLAQPPFVPDFWNSSSPSIPAEEEVLPKLVVVGGAATHHGGGPTHSSMDLENNVAAQTTERSDSFLDDIADDLGLPPIADRLKRFYSYFN